MMILSELREEIKSILSGVPEVGIVHDYSRWNEDYPSFLELFKSPAHSQIRGWEISRIKKPEINKSTRTNIASYLFVIRGYMSHNDLSASEKTFDDLVELVETAFRNKPTLNGKALDVSPLQLEAAEPRMFGGVLCHYAEGYLTIQKEIQWTE